MFAITVDNATANDFVVGYVTMQLLIWRNDDALVLAGQYMHVRCCAHILNLIVVSGFEYACELLCTYFDFDCCFRIVLSLFEMLSST